MIAIEFVKNADPEQPNTQLTQDVIANAPKHGLVLLACGFYGDVIRFLPALTIPDALIEEGLDNFVTLFESLTAKSKENLKAS
jgi:4-aminobutyrate aminotransferase/(S)-3-amino-2-methylpropionate transaminase